MQSALNLSWASGDDFADDFEFVDIEPEVEVAKGVLPPPDGVSLSREHSRPGSETPSTLTFPALANVNALIPTPHARSKTPHLELPTTATSGEDPASKSVKPPTRIRKSVNDEESQKENEPPALATSSSKVDEDSLELPLIAHNPIRFDGFSDVYSCKVCGMHVSRETEVESKSFQVGEGPFTEAKRGYLFRSAVNLRQGPARPEHFTTGIYTISYVDCFGCGSQFGWKYLGAEKSAGRAKIGKFCLKCALLERLEP